MHGDAKAEFDSQANLAGNQTVGIFAMVMTMVTVHVFQSHGYCDKRKCLQRNLVKSADMEIFVFTTFLSQLNNNLPSFPLGSVVGQDVEALNTEKFKDVLYIAMPDSWKRKMMVQGYNYLDPLYLNISLSHNITVIQHWCKFQIVFVKYMDVYIFYLLSLTN